MNNLHVVILEDFEECFVSNTEAGLREQVSESLTNKSIAPPTDQEWSVCILSKGNEDFETSNLSLGLISYYKTDSRLGPKLKHASEA